MRPAACLMLLVATACTGPEQDACGLRKTLPDVASGSLEATRDGQAYRAPDVGLKGYSLRNDRTNIVAGDVTLEIGKDQDGNTVDALINEGKFPICIPLNDQADGTTYALVNSSGASFITDGTNTGVVAILGKEGDELVGRFEFSARQNGGDATTRFEDGAFRLGPR